jgi:anti-anti-sigma factor
LHNSYHSGNRLEVEVDRDDGRSTIRLAGELDTASVPLFSEALEGEWTIASIALVDLGRLTFADSTGIKALVEATRRAQSDGPQLLMTRPTGEVARLFELTGLHSVLPFATDEAGG